MFRTYALDLGLYTNAAYHYAHFLHPNSLMIKDFSESILGSHFDLYLLIFSPLTYLFGSYTLPLVQLTAVIFGGFGVYKYFHLKNESKIAFWASAFFFSFFGVFGALSYDYHSVVVAACLIPWFFIAVSQNKHLQSSLLLLLLIISQENISLWILFVCLGLFIEYRKDYKKRLYLLLFALISGVYFIAVTQWIIPHFSESNAYTGLRYSFLGNNLTDAINTLFTHPLESLKALFINHNGSDVAPGVKLELHRVLLLSGLPFLLKKPQYLVMLIPIYFQKLFHDDPAMWGIGHQYNIEFTPIFAIGIFTVISEIKREKIKRYSMILVPIIAFITTFDTTQITKTFTDKDRIRIYQKPHYNKSYDVAKVHQILNKIPRDAKVSAQSPFVPHLALRPHIYNFPKIHDAEYIIISRKESSYPLTNSEFEERIETYKKSEDWLLKMDEDLIVFKKKHRLNSKY